MQPPKRPPEGRPPAGRQAPSRYTAERRQPGPTRTNAAPRPWLQRTFRVRRGHVVALVLVLLALLGIFVLRNVRLRTLKNEMEETNQHAEQVLTELAERERELKFSGTEAFIEQQARDLFGYIHDGEYRFLPENSAFGQTLPPDNKEE